MKTIKNGIIDENPTLVLMLGLCPTLAVTNNFESAYIMGICVLLVLLFSNFTVSIIKKLIPENVRIPVYIIIIATFVTSVEMLLQKYAPPIHEILGIYLPLITVNCIVLGRAIAVASKEKIGKSILDAIGIGLGFTLSLSMIGLVREVLGNNTITLMNGISPLTGYKAVYQIFPTTDYFPIDFFLKPAGAFLTLGLFLALFNFIKEKRGERK